MENVRNGEEEKEVWEHVRRNCKWENLVMFAFLVWGVKYLLAIKPLPEDPISLEPHTLLARTFWGPSFTSTFFLVPDLSSLFDSHFDN